jgi:AmmeMemoRadiSam system protein B/AmmeMemoRadiSam system protein A
MAPISSRPELTMEQKQQLIAAARDLVRNLAADRKAVVPASALAGFAEHLVAGVFVSLKRGKHLRACCGMMGQPIPLLTALQEAATRTVWDDVRFPPVSSSEIDHLHMEIWLLHSPEPVQAQGAQRADAVTVGRHGIQVVRGQQHGLFLPAVALENEWDNVRFLDQVCVKAGLHPSSWRDDATTLYTFEGEVVRGPLAVGDIANRAIAERRTGICRLEDVSAFANFCRDNISAMLQGATPNYFLPGASDGNVIGAILTLQHSDYPGSVKHFCELSLRPGVPLQSTLYALCQSVAQTLAHERLTREKLAGLQVNVAILHDPTLHGTVQDPDLAGVDPRHRAILVAERNKTAVVFDPSRQPTELLAEAARQANVAHPAGAAVFSLDALSMTPFTFSTAPRPVRGHAERRPAGAGSFYPADAAELARLVDGLLEGEATAEAWPAAMVPHAGLVYSGRLAAQVLKRVQIPRTVIVIGPKHTALGMDWAIAPHQTWSFPGGSLESDFLLARQLSQAIPGLEMDAAAHQREHAIEVELPLLARLAPQTRVVGLAIGSGDLASCQRAAEGLAGVLKEREDRPLLLISSDMNHYATDAENRRLDALALTALERLDPVEIYETVTRNQISMCGLLPAVIVLQTLQMLGGLRKAERVGYATSADVTGNTSRVVGYAGMLFG